MNRRTPANTTGLGVIRADELMPQSVAAARLGFGAKTIARARREGLKTVEFGRMRYVRGCDLLDWFGELVEQQHGGNGEVE